MKTDFRIGVPVVQPPNRKLLLFPDGLLPKGNRRSFAYHPKLKNVWGPVRSG